MDTKIFSGIITQNKGISLHHYKNVNKENGIGLCLGTLETIKTKSLTTKTTLPSSSTIGGIIKTPPIAVGKPSLICGTGTINGIIPSLLSSSSMVSSLLSTSTSSTTSSVPVSKQVTIGGNIVQHNNNNNSIIPSDILDDLASCFIINVPDDERNNLIRICFQIELAHWFYLDFFCSVEDKKLMPCGMKHFAMPLFQHIPFLRAHLSGIDKILEDWGNLHDTAIAGRVFGVLL